MPLCSRSCYCPQCRTQNPAGCVACWKCGYPMSALSGAAARSSACRRLSTAELESLLSEAQIIQIFPASQKGRRRLDWLSGLWRVKGRKS